MASESKNAYSLRIPWGTWTDEANFTGAHDSNCMTAAAANAVSGEFDFLFTNVRGEINGIEVLVHVIAGDADDFVTVELKDSTATWVSKTITAPGAGAVCADCVDKTVGGSADTWGGTWTAAYIRTRNLRIRLTTKATGKGGGYWAADYCLVTVHYTPLSDTFALADTITRQIVSGVPTHTRSLTDAYTLADSISRQKGVVTHTRSLTDAFTLADTITRQLVSGVATHTRSLTDASTLADTVSTLKEAVIYQSLADALTLADSISRQKGVVTHTRSLTDAFTLADTVSTLEEAVPPISSIRGYMEYLLNPSYTSPISSIRGYEESLLNP